MLGTTWLSGGATLGSERGRIEAFPPFVTYGRAFQARTADELDLLPDGSAIEAMPSGHAVIREPARTNG